MKQQNNTDCSDCSQDCRQAVTFYNRTIAQVTDEPTLKERDAIDYCRELVMGECKDRMHLVTRYVFDGKDTTFIAERKLEVNLEDAEDFQVSPYYGD